MLLWLSSRAALTNLASGSPFWNVVDDRLSALAAEIASHNPDQVAAALDRQLRQRADAMLAGLDAYRHHSYRRPPSRAAVRWRRGAARLLDYGRRGVDGGAAVLLVPSLINRHYILDLLPERSFVRDLAAAGLRPLVLDWGEPGEAERDFTLGDYIAGILEGAIDAAVEVGGGRVALCGYCMGGLLALAAASRRAADIACLALLATPWDFHAERQAQAELLESLVEGLPRFIGDRDAVPVSVIQSFFVGLDPFLAERKFIRFAGLAADSAAARGFVALEDWINDGVPLARQVALECAGSWYRDNQPGRGSWQVAGQPVLPQAIAAPTLVVLPSRDRIVPPRSAEALATALPNATVLRPPLGHIGMMASARAPETIWRPIADWLRVHLG